MLLPIYSSCVALIIFRIVIDIIYFLIKLAISLYSTDCIVQSISICRVKQEKKQNPINSVTNYSNSNQSETLLALSTTSNGNKESYFIFKFRYTLVRFV